MENRFLHLTIIVCFLALFSWDTSHGKNNKKIIDKDDQNQSWEKKLEEDRKILRRMFKEGTFFKGIEKEVEKMFKDFDKGFEKFFQDGIINSDYLKDFLGDDNFQKLLDNPDFYDLYSNEFEWKETQKARILIVRIKAPKGSPTDIKIAKGRIVISGKKEVKNKYQAMHGAQKEIRIVEFKNEFAIPRDTDADRAKIESKQNEIHIILPKKDSSIKTPIKISPLKKGLPDKKTSPDRKKVPIKRKEGEPII